MKFKTLIHKWIQWPYRQWLNWRAGQKRAAVRRQGRWATVSCAELPDQLEKQTLYLWGEEGQIWQAVMICPCGCQSALHMSTLADDWPHWKVEQHADGTATLAPSVWRKIGCRSHFFLRHGQIQWCQPTPEI